MAGDASLHSAAKVGRSPGATRTAARGRRRRMQPAPPALDRLGDYRIIREIGGGGMGIVYEAEREALRSKVALKVMHPKLRNRSDYLQMVPPRGPGGGGVAPYQHRHGLRLRPARRRLLLRHAIHRRSQPRQGAGGREAAETRGGGWCARATKRPTRTDAPGAPLEATDPNVSAA